MQARCAPISDDELASWRARFADAWPAAAHVIEAISWRSDDGRQHLKIWIEADGRDRVWTIEQAAGESIVTARPATDLEIAEVREHLRAAGVSDDELARPVASADVDMRRGARAFTLSFTRLADMIEGDAYPRFYVRYHDDAREPSIAFTLETRRGGWFHTLPGGRILRGDPWS